MEEAGEPAAVAGLDRRQHFLDGTGDAAQRVRHGSRVVEDDVGPEFGITGRDPRGIAPAAGGECQGVGPCGRCHGRRAVELALAEIGKHGDVQRIWTIYQPDNAVARELYAACGFTEAGTEEDGELYAVWTPDPY